MKAKEMSEEPTWRPISDLPLFSAIIDEMLAGDIEQYQTLLEAREKPYVLDDATVARVIKVYSAHHEDLDLFEQQFERWHAEGLTEQQAQEVDRLSEQIAENRQVIAAVLALTDELKENTIEKVLAKSDFELGLEFLLGKRKL